MKQVLKEAATPDIITAWTKAYEVLSDLLIDQEKAIRNRLMSQVNGYDTWSTFRVTRKIPESSEITSIYFQPEESGKLVLKFTPGQYLSIRVQIPGEKYAAVRNYSISCPPGLDYFRISV